MLRGQATLVVLTLMAGLPAAAKEQGSPRLKCVDYPSESPLQVCTQLDESALSRPGQKTTWRILVHSGWKKVQVRLHNSSPGVVQLEAGNDQTVHMGCIQHREVLRTVVSVGPGVPQLEARPHYPSPQQESSAIAASLMIL